MQGEVGELTRTIDDAGRLKMINLPRWGDPEGAAFHCVDFGVLWRRSVRLEVIPFRAACESVTMSAQTGLCRTASSSEPQLTRRRIGNALWLHGGGSDSAGGHGSFPVVAVAYPADLFESGLEPIACFWAAVYTVPRVCAFAV